MWGLCFFFFVIGWIGRIIWVCGVGGVLVVFCGRGWCGWWVGVEGWWVVLMVELRNGKFFVGRGCLWRV